MRPLDHGQAGGFTGDEIAALRTLLRSSALPSRRHRWPALPVAVVETYLGRDAGQRVLQRPHEPRHVDRMNAVLWFSDMRGYTTLSETIYSDQLIPLLNDYAEAVISAVHGAGGDVLKLMGDGTLAIFTDPDPANACVAAMRAEADLRLRLPNSTGGAPRPASRSARSISACMSATSSTAISAARTGSTSPSWARRSTRPAASLQCAVPSTGVCSSRRVLRSAGGGTSNSCRSAVTRCAASAGRRNSSRSTLNWQARIDASQPQCTPRHRPDARRHPLFAVNDALGKWLVATYSIGRATA